MPTIPMPATVHLPLGWKITFEPRDDGSPQGFLIGPKGQHASLNFALGMGHCSDDAESPLPLQVRSRLREYEQYE